MKWTVTTPPASRLVDWPTAKAHLRLSSNDEQGYVEQLIDAATDYAEEALGASLVSREITAVFYVGDVTQPTPIVPNNGHASPLSQWSSGFPGLRLTRGPVSAISSVTDGRGNTLTGSAYSLEKVGHRDLLRLNASAPYPITVVYTAGFGATSDVPASIRQAVLCLVGTLYERRESVLSGTIVTTIPHNVDDFFRLKSHRIGVG